jgi:hypothetical protein
MINLRELLGRRHRRPEHSKVKRMTYYEPRVLDYLPECESIRYCSLIARLVLIINKVCNCSGWHVFASRRGVEPLCGNEHCVFNCIDDEQIEEQSHRFVLPEVVNRRKEYTPFEARREVFQDEQERQNQDARDFLYTVFCYNCGLESLDESRPGNGKGYTARENCPACGGKDLERREWTPTPARTKAEAQKAFDAFSRSARDENPPEAHSEDLSVLTRKLVAELSSYEEGEAKEALLVKFKAFYDQSDESSRESVKEILSAMIEKEEEAKASRMLLEQISGAEQ